MTELKTYYFKSPENDVYAFQSQSEAPSVFVEITEGEAVNGINKTHDDILTEKLKELAVFTDSMFNPIWNTYSQAEVQSWPEQEAEAIAWTQDNAASTPTIDALNPVETKAEFCKIILRNAEQFKAMMVMVGWSQHVRGQLKAMTLEGLKTANPAAMMNATRALKGM